MVEIAKCPLQVNIERSIVDVTKAISAAGLRIRISAIKAMTWPDIATVIYHHVILASTARRMRPS
jgi:hypothetical protein